MPWSRASELQRAIACPASTHLVRLRLPSETRDKAAAWGNTIHEWKETGLWPEGRVFARRKEALEAAAISRTDLWPVDGRHEVAFALHSANRIVAQHEGSKEEREAWKSSLGPEWVTGTTDWWGDYLGTPWVDDLKTGKAEWLDTAPWNHWQLRFYSLCVAMLTGASEVRLSITHWPQYPADGLPKRYWHTAQREELLGLTLPLIEYARQAAAKSKEELDARPSADSCRFCDCIKACPVGHY